MTLRMFKKAIRNHFILTYNNIHTHTHTHEVMLLGLRMLHTRLPSKNPSAMHKKPPLELFVRVAQETSKTNTGYCCCLWLLPRGKIPYPSDTGLTASDVDLTESTLPGV